MGNFYPQTKIMPYDPEIVETKKNDRLLLTFPNVMGTFGLPVFASFACSGCFMHLSNKGLNSQHFKDCPKTTSEGNPKPVLKGCQLIKGEMLMIYLPERLNPVLKERYETGEQETKLLLSLEEVTNSQLVKDFVEHSSSSIIHSVEQKSTLMYSIVYKAILLHLLQHHLPISRRMQENRTNFTKSEEFAFFSSHEKFTFRLKDNVSGLRNIASVASTLLSSILSFYIIRNKPEHQHLVNKAWGESQYFDPIFGALQARQLDLIINILMRHQNTTSNVVNLPFEKLGNETEVQLEEFNRASISKFPEFLEMGNMCLISLDIMAVKRTPIKGYGDNFVECYYQSPMAFGLLSLSHKTEYGFLGARKVVLKPPGSIIKYFNGIQ